MLIDLSFMTQSFLFRVELPLYKSCQHHYGVIGFASYWRGLRRILQPNNVVGDFIPPNPSNTM